MRTPSVCIAAGIFVGLLAVSSMAGEVYAGFKGGLGLNSFTGKDAKDMGGLLGFPDELNVPMSLSKSMKIGFCFGGFVNYKIVDMVGIEGSLLYNIKGQNYDLSGTISQGGYSLNLSESLSFKGSYLDIPVLFKFYIPTAVAAKPVLFAGPSFNINLTSEIQDEIKASFMGESMSQDTTMDFKEKINGFEMGIIMGGGMEIPLVSGSIIFQAHYFLGLTKLQKKLTEIQKDASATDLLDIKNSQIAVTVGYGFRL